jgi:tyrosine-specific transport protein
MNKLFGSILLLAGCAIGTGMLGLPIVTGIAGFFPSLFILIFAWAFMLATSLLLAKVCLSFGSREVNLITMATETLGKGGKWVTFLLFSFLFYALMVAYSIATTRLISDLIMLFVGWTPPFAPTLVVIALLLFLAIVKGVRSCDLFNRALMLGLVICYIFLVSFGIFHVKPERLLYHDLAMIFGAIPIPILSFGVQNLIPTLVTYLDRKKSAINQALVIGSLFPLIVYVAWQVVMLGIIPYATRVEWLEARLQGEIVTGLLQKVAASPSVLSFARGFGFFAVATSFLPVALSFCDFIRDGFRLTNNLPHRISVGLVVFIPPMILALTKPSIFLVALSYAGGVAAVLLFGLLPSLMALKKKLAPRGVLLFLIGLSISILFITLYVELGML